MLGSISTYIPLLKKVITNRVFKNFSYLTLGTGLSQLLSLFAILKITNDLAPDEYGLFTFMVAQGLLLLTISNLGTTSILVRSIARNPSKTNDLVYNGILLRSAALATLAFFYSFYNYYWGSLTETQVLMVFMFTMVSCLYDITENVFHGNQKMLAPSAINLIYSLTWFITICLLPSFYNNVNFIFLIYFLLNALKAAISIVLIKNQGLLIGKMNAFWLSSKNFVKESWPYFVMVLIMLPVTSFANNFLALNTSINEIAFFNLSQRLIQPISLLIGIVFTPLFPNLSALWIKDEQRFHHVICFGFRYFMLLTLTLCFLFDLYAQEIISSLFPAKYFPAINVSKTQVWYIFLTSINSLIGTILGAVNKEKLILRFAVIYSLFCTPIFIYASKFGALGLSYGYVVSFAICLVYVWYAFEKTLKLKIQHGTYFWILAIAMFSVLRLIPSDIQFYYKLILSFPVLVGSVFYISKTYTSISVRK